MLRLAEKRVWLAGGGLGQPWTYQNLIDALDEPSRPEPRGVAEVLLQVTQAVWRGEPIALDDVVWAGEGSGSTLRSATSVSAPALDRLAPALLLNRTNRISLKTPGSTGAPKTVTHRLETLTRGVSVGERHRDDVWGLAFNPTHMAGLQVYFQALANLNAMVNI